MIIKIKIRLVDMLFFTRNQKKLYALNYLSFIINVNVDSFPYNWVQRSIQLENRATDKYILYE